jgi:hypothetical protein
MVDPFSLAISTLSLAISAATAWLTLFRRGTVKMTQPTVIFFGPDVPRSRGEAPLPKIYLRSLLFATSKRGRVIESMHVALYRNEMHQNFNIWVYGERDRLVRGSGLFVGETGVSANHHFLTPEDGKTFSVIEGHYKLEVFAHRLGDPKPIRLFSQELDLSRDIVDLYAREKRWVVFRLGAGFIALPATRGKAATLPRCGSFFAAFGIRSPRRLNAVARVNLEFVRTSA